MDVGQLEHQPLGGWPAANAGGVVAAAHPHIAPRGSRRRTLGVVGALTVALAPGGCAALGEQARISGQAGQQKGYICGTGSVTQIPATQRGQAVSITGPSTHPAPVDTTSMRGQVVVVNLWYAGCGPCQAEAPDLVAAAAQHPDAQFVGINTTDSAATAQAFERKHAISWPSVLDANSKSAVLALGGITSPQAVPTTLVLDRQGRVAARVLGSAEPDILNALITEVTTET